MKNELPTEIAQLIEQLQSLRVQEDEIIGRIIAATTASTAPASVQHEPADPPSRPNPRANSLQVGDRVRYKGTKINRGGFGEVVGFTEGPDPFVRIRKEGSAFILHGPTEVKRKTHNVDRID
jgi:hypothetical protein